MSDRQREAERRQENRDGLLRRLGRGFRKRRPSSERRDRGGGLTGELRDTELGRVEPHEVSEAVDEAMTWGGDPNAFYRLVLRMGSAGSVYRSATRTRRHAITQIEPMVVPAGESAADMLVAEAVTEHVLPVARRLAPVLLRAASHGLSVCEVQWDLDSIPVRPAVFRWRWPGQFRASEYGDEQLYQARSGQGDQYSDDENMTPLMPGDGRWVDHRTDEDGAPPFVSGAATPCMFWWLAKLRARVRWAAYLDTYGYPLRVGRYDADASKDDLTALRTALLNMGRDVGALLPEGVDIDVLTMGSGSSSVAGQASLFRELVAECDRQTEIEVLGQTATTEGTPGRLGGDDAQDRVRRDIALADARGLGRTITDHMAAPFVELNHGPDVLVPEVLWVVPEPPQDLNAWSRSVGLFVDRGLDVRAEDVRERLRLARPDPDDPDEELLMPDGGSAAGDADPSGGESVDDGDGTGEDDGDG